MRSAYETAKIIGGTIRMTRGVERHSIVAPVPVPRKIRNWHYFDDSNSEPDQMFKMIDNREIGPSRRERTKRQFINGPVGDVGPAPSFVCPTKGRRIDNLGRTMYA